MQKQSFLRGKLTCTTEIALNHNISHHHRGSPATLMSPSKDASSPIWLPACAVLIWLVLPSQQGKRNGDSNQILNGEQKRNAVTGRPALCCAVLCSSCIRRNLLLPLLPPFPPPLRLRLTDSFTSSRQIPPRHHHHHPRRPTNFPRSREASRDAGFEARILGLAPRRLRVGVQSPRGSCSDSPGGRRGECSTSSCRRGI
jgi:hypothetical protein